MMQASVVFLALMVARVGACVAVLPLLGGPQMPRTVKAGLTMALTLSWMPGFLERLPLATSLWQSAPVPWLGFGLSVIREVLLGVVLGYAFGLLLIPARVAGEFLSQEMGLSFSSLVNVTGDGSATPLAVLFEMLASALFFGLDGHHVFLAVIHGTFLRFPVGEGLTGTALMPMLEGATLAQEQGLILAAPMALCLLLITTVLMVLARSNPQLNLYTVGFPLRLGAGLVVLLLLLPQFITGVTMQLSQWIDHLSRLW